LPTEINTGPRTRLGAGVLDQLGAEARALGFRRVLLVADPGLDATRHVTRAEAALQAAGIVSIRFADFTTNPDGLQVARAADAARAQGVDAFVALGGGSSLDCAKGANLLLAGGGRIADYRGHGRARGVLLPMIGIPTTAGTGSEAQSYALVSDPETHEKLACGDQGLLFRLVLLDPELLRTAPRTIAAEAGADALAHAVETFVSTRRNPRSDALAIEAFRSLSANYAACLGPNPPLVVLEGMLVGAHHAGGAIEASMLGAAHACANPLTARFGTAHGLAVGLMLPHVVRFNAPEVSERYAALLRAADVEPGAEPGERLAALLESLAVSGGLPRRLGDLGIATAQLDGLAAHAAEQWTGTFNPRPFDRAAALELYRAAL